MPILNDNLRSNPSGQGVSVQRGLEVPPAPPADVRSIVERQFTLMEQTHDRIRTEELAVRLGERMAS